MGKFKMEFMSAFNTKVYESESFDCMVDNVLNLVKLQHFNNPYFLNSSIGMFKNMTHENIKDLFKDASTISEVGEDLCDYVYQNLKDHYIKEQNADIFKNFIKKINYKSETDFAEFKKKFIN